MSTKTKMILGTVAAMILLPLATLAMRLDDVRYALDSGHSKLTADQLLKGKRPKSYHVTVTHGHTDASGGVDYILKENGVERERWTYIAFHSATDPSGPAPVLLVTKNQTLNTAADQWSGIWTNGNTGLSKQVIKLFAEQGITFIDKALVLEIDASRESKIVDLAVWTGGAFGVPLLVLISLLVIAPMLGQNEQRQEKAKELLKDELDQIRAAMRQAIEPMLPMFGPSDGSVQVRGSTVLQKVPHFVLAYDGEEHPVPPELVQIMMRGFELLKRNKVKITGLSYLVIDGDPNNWRDTLSFH